MIDFVAPPQNGRRFTSRVSVRLSDAGTSGTLRLDGIARFLQDVATEDWEDTGIATGENWVVRRTTIKHVDERWPVINETLSLMTWCGGVGAAWAERRTSVCVENTVVLEAAALWVPVDASGHPVRIRQAFLDVYGEAIQGRKIAGRVQLIEPDPGMARRPWPLRRADLDVLGHVNNAAVWQAVSEVVDVPVSLVEVIHHGPVEDGHDVQLVSAPGAMWLLVDDQVRVAARFET